MSVEGLILHHGEAHGVTLHQTRVDYLVTAENSKQCSLFEFTVAPGFNTGAHYHTKIEEIFYVLEGELDFTMRRTHPTRRAGDLCVRPSRRGARIRKLRFGTGPDATDHRAAWA
jgi:quercetin dioxygenase-like cupin family protein